jgi:hypothetical protein
MRRPGHRFLAVFVLAAALAAAPPALALVPRADPTMAQNIALADVVVVGKVTALDEKRVSAGPPLKVPGAKPIEYQLATVEVSDSLVGAKDVREMRVAVIAPPGENDRRGRAFRRWPPVKLAVGQEACLFLTRHPDEPFYLLLAPYHVLDRTAKTFDADLALARRCVELLADPTKALGSKDANERLFTAAMLIHGYRTPRVVYRDAPKTEPVAADLSRLILETLAEADWSAPNGPVSPHAAFVRLGLTDKDGWTQPDDFREFAPAARKWLRERADSYRIQRYVPEEKVPPKE